eukprot:13001197-Alexandrium_andersonii.AAC.1
MRAHAHASILAAAPLRETHTHTHTRQGNCKDSQTRTRNAGPGDEAADDLAAARRSSAPAARVWFREGGNSTMTQCMSL